jgi:AI-2 transport protein TqsA
MVQESQLRYIQTVCLLALTAVVVGAAGHWLQPVLVPFVLALFFAIGLTPLVELSIRKLHLPRPVAVTLTLLLALIAMVALSLLVVESMRNLAANASDYQTQFNVLVQRVITGLGIDERWNVSAQDVNAWMADVSGRNVQDFLVSTTGAIVGLVSNGVLVIIFLCFLLFGGGTTRAGTAGPWAEGIQGTRRYILTKVLLSGATGVLVGSILWLLGVPLAVAFGLLAFLLNFIPSIGSIIATLLPLPMVLLIPDVSLAKVLLAVLLPGAVQFTIGNIVEPRMMGRRFDLHPIVILMALIFFGMLWGVVGMFLATPLTAVAKSLLLRSELTAPVGEMLAGRVDFTRPPKPQGP